ncbi:MAG: transferase [Solirubrobacteraceae bacterium]|nr:transferase [Solirubrobacteraceae bacterium]
MSARSSRPSVAELRAATQPPTIFERNSGEHWAGKLYVRRFSPYATRAFLATPITPNGVTWLMILDGLLAALALTLPGIVPALAAFALIQLQILLDCSDGELARWKGISSPVGIYLDRVGHYVTETALPIGLGIRADGGWDHIGSYTTLGLIAALLQVLVKAETALVHVARNEAGLPPVRDHRDVVAPRAAGLAALRRAAGRLPFYRVFVAMEFTLVALAAAIGDKVAGTLDVTRGVLYAIIAAGAITVAGHLFAILTSDRLR